MRTVPANSPTVRTGPAVTKPTTKAEPRTPHQPHQPSIISTMGLTEVRTVPAKSPTVSTGPAVTRPATKADPRTPLPTLEVTWPVCKNPAQWDLLGLKKFSSVRFTWFEKILVHLTFLHRSNLELVKLPRNVLQSIYCNFHLKIQSDYFLDGIAVSLFVDICCGVWQSKSQENPNNNLMMK